MLDICFWWLWRAYQTKSFHSSFLNIKTPQRLKGKKKEKAIYDFYYICTWNSIYPPEYWVHSRINLPLVWHLVFCYCSMTLTVLFFHAMWYLTLFQLDSFTVTRIGNCLRRCDDSITWIAFISVSPWCLPKAGMERSMLRELPWAIQIQRGWPWQG